GETYRQQDGGERETAGDVHERLLVFLSILMGNREARASITNPPARSNGRILQSGVGFIVAWCPPVFHEIRRAPSRISPERIELKHMRLPVVNETSLRA